MDVMKVVENIQHICKQKGTTPTVACRESGAGKDLVSNMKRKQILPSIEKMRLLANYLGTSIDELIGETKEPDTTAGIGSPSENELIFRSLPPDLQEEALRYMRYLVAEKQKQTSAKAKKESCEPDEA